MRLVTLAKNYRAIAKEMRREAVNYRYLRHMAGLDSSTTEDLKKYDESWQKLLQLNEQAYYIMTEARTLAHTKLYRAIFAMGLMPRQHGFKYDQSRTFYKFDQLINLLRLV